MVPDRSYVSIVLSGATLDPLFWNSYFSVNADFSAVKGGDYTDRSGRRITSRSPRGLWIVSTEFRNEALALDDHFQVLKSLLFLPRADFVASLKSRSVNCLFSCFVANYNATNPASLNAESKALAASCNAQVDIDLYPQLQKVKRADGALIDVQI